MEMNRVAIGKKEMRGRYVMNRMVAMLLPVMIALVGCSGAGGSAPATASSESKAMQAAPMAPAPATAEVAYDTAASYESGGYAMNTADDAYRDDAAFTQESATVAQKIILEANLSMATDRFDEVTAQIRNVTQNSGGYVQDSNQSTRYDGVRFLNITLRVPSENYDFVLTQLKNVCVLQQASENQRNATAEYYDIQARLDTKLIEEERLLELISRTEKVEDILKLEELLGEIRTQIEVYQSQLTNIDRLASYSTISVYLEEVMDEAKVVVPSNLSEKMYAGFIKSINSTVRFFQNVLIVLAGLSVPLFVLLVAVLVILGLFRIRRAVRNNRRKE